MKKFEYVFDCSVSPLTFNGLRNSDTPYLYQIARKVREIVGDSIDYEIIKHIDCSYVTWNPLDNELPLIVMGTYKSIRQLREELSNYFTTDIQKYRPNGVIAF